MEKIKKQTEFSRTRYNEAKMGAYYTDLDHCRRIFKFLEFPEEEVCCLEPSIGDGEAVLAVTGKDVKGAENIKVFGVELNDETYREVSKRSDVFMCLKADFLNDVIISHHSFSFVFMNPPYGTLEDGMRYETAFLRKVVPYMTKGAVIVAVVPGYVAYTEDFLEEWCDKFSTICAYRFSDGEYEKYRQVVLMGRRSEGSEEDEKERLAGMLKEAGSMDILPQDYSGEKIMVSRSYEKNVAEFMNRSFDFTEAGKAVRQSPLQDLVKERLFVPPYIVDNLGRPPVMPSEGQMYLLAVSGAGQGLVGKEENGDLHLQRGVAKINKRSEYVSDENGNLKEVETSYPQINFNLIEADGKVTTLQ